MSKAVIGLTGRKKSGKDTVCEIIGELLTAQRVSWKRIAFADPLKEELAAACGVTVEEINAQKDRYRGGLQWWGTEFRRTDDPDYWVKQAVKKIRQSLASVVIVTDCRFDNEAEAITQLGGVVLSVHRRGATVADYHASEGGVDVRYVSADIHNIGTIEDLRSDVIHALESLEKRGRLSCVWRATGN